jgi:cytochrome c oxidase cbb3-type subunit 3
MNDFTLPILPFLLCIVVLFSVLVCGVFLYIQARQKVRLSFDENSNTTGHVWDENLKELNNPMPRWWMWLFYGNIVFALAYLWMFPGLGGFVGMLDWTSEQQYQTEAKKLNDDIEPLYAQFRTQSLESVATDARAKAIGQRLFLNNCAQCHGSDARGSKGFPNLTDQDWLYGGSPQAIETSIAKGRKGMMPSMLAAVGDEKDARQVAQYVLSLSGLDNDAVKAQLGREKFKAVCTGCHGSDGHGNPLLGAPNLSDRVWLHGGTETAIVETISKGRAANMPAHESLLSADQIRVLSAYVWGLSNTVKTALAQ